MMASLVLYTQFFTRIPLPIAVKEPERRFKEGVLWFALFGLLMGMLEAGFFWLATLVLHQTVAWMAVLLFDVFLTGAFHMDALADTCDGLFSSRKPEQMLEIMKDSRVGTNGVLALIFYYGLLMLPMLLAAHSYPLNFWLRVIITLQVVGNAGMTLSFWRMTYAGQTAGLGRLFLGVATWRIVGTQVIAVGVLYLLFGWKACLCYGGVILLQVGYRKLVYQKIGGMNGDTLGAYYCIAQIIFLLLFLR